MILLPLASFIGFNTVRTGLMFFKNPLLENYLTSILHAGIVATFSLLNTFYYDFEYSNQICSISLGYFIYDIIDMYRSQTINKYTVLHHSFISYCIGYSLYIDYNIYLNIISTMLILEYNSINLHIRYLLKKHNLISSYRNMYDLNKFCLLFTFIIFRFNMMFNLLIFIIYYRRIFLTDFEYYLALSTVCYLNLFNVSLFRRVHSIQFK